MAVHPNSLENLKKAKRFEKGVSHSPGRPRKLPVLDILMSEVLGDEKDGQTAAKVILLKLRQKAIAGDQRAAEYLLDRAYGKPKQTEQVEHTGRIITGFEFID